MVVAPPHETRPLRRSFAAAALVAFAVTTAARPAMADDREADRLFKEASDAQKAGRYEEACTKFAASNRIERALGTEYNLAACYELTKKYASARKAYVGAADLAQRSGRSAVARDATQRAARLESRVPRLVLRVSKSARQATITCDGTTMSREEIDTAVELDPGSHRIRATAEGRVPFEQTIDLAEGQRTELVIALEASEAPRPAAAPYTPSSRESMSLLPTSMRSPPRWSIEGPAPRSGLGPIEITGIAVAGAGVVALGLSAVFAAKAGDARDESGCRDGRVCPDDASADRLRDARSSANVATALVIGGGIFVASGAAFFFLAPKRGTSVAIAPSVSPAMAGAAFHGSF